MKKRTHSTKSDSSMPKYYTTFLNPEPNPVSLFETTKAVVGLIGIPIILALLAFLKAFQII